MATSFVLVIAIIAACAAGLVLSISFILVVVVKVRACLEERKRKPGDTAVNRNIDSVAREWESLERQHRPPRTHGRRSDRSPARPVLLAEPIYGDSEAGQALPRPAGQYRTVAVWGAPGEPLDFEENEMRHCQEYSGPVVGTMVGRANPCEGVYGEAVYLSRSHPPTPSQ